MSLTQFVFFLLKVNGLRAPSALLRLPTFDIVKGIGVDSMHCIFLGVVKQLLTLWFSSKHSGQQWSCLSDVERVDKRLLQIQPPNIITRTPRSIESHLRFWKGNLISKCYTLMIPGGTGFQVTGMIKQLFWG